MKWVYGGVVALFVLLGGALGYWYTAPGSGVRLPAVQVEVGDYAAFHEDEGPRVVLYTLSTCPVCAVAKNSLETNGVEYVERSLDRDDAFRKDLRSLGARSVPLMIAGTHKVEGFDAAVYLETFQAERLIR